MHMYRFPHSNSDFSKSLRMNRLYIIYTEGFVNYKVISFFMFLNTRLHSGCLNTIKVALCICELSLLSLIFSKGH